MNWSHRWYWCPCAVMIASTCPLDDCETCSNLTAIQISAEMMMSTCTAIANLSAMYANLHNEARTHANSYISQSSIKKFIMSALNNVVTLYKQLKTEWNAKKQNLSKCGQLLAQLKVGLTSLMFLPTSNTAASQQELLIARDILEIGAQWSIEAKDIPSFERYMSQLKCYYFDYNTQLPESAFKYQLLGLNLLFLLSQNRVAEFHTELELLPSDRIQSDVYIKHPLSLEQYLIEGSYNKIFLAKGNVPAQNYNFFMDILLDTIRGEIAVCLEKAYEKISLNEAARMLYMPNTQSIREYGTKKNWKLGRDNFYHFAPEIKKQDDPIPSTELAEQALSYARELEMIV
ncbi:Regulatory particle non-ATPase 12 [Carabus blaptoides fortunei]